MKTLLAFGLLLTSLSTFARCNREAQFVGTVKELKTLATENKFSFKIKLGYKGNYWFQPSIMCGMWEDEAEAATIIMQGQPAIKNGDQVSGILIFDEALQAYRIE